MSRRIYVSNITVPRTKTGTVTVRLNSQGDEIAYSFSVHFDPNAFELVPYSIKMGVGMPPASIINMNLSRITEGKLGVLLEHAKFQDDHTGIESILVFKLKVKANAPVGKYTTALSGTPTLQSVAGENAELHQTTYVNGSLTVK